MDAEYFIHPFPLRGLPLSLGKKTKTKTHHPLCPPETGATSEAEGVDKNHSPLTAPNTPPPPSGWSSVALGSAPLMRYKMTFSHFSKDLIHPLFRGDSLS